MERTISLVDIRQELRSMCGWLQGNPQKRKTKAGILRFINNWLARTQQKGGNRYGGAGGTAANIPGVREAVQRRRNTANISDHESHCMEAVNALPGKLDGYDCPVCKNKGVVYILKDGYEYARRCECMDIRESVWS